MQELAHIYLRSSRYGILEDALEIITGYNVAVWPLEFQDVTLARQLHEQHPHLSARDLCHLASCQRRGVRELKTFDRALEAVADTERA